MDKIYSEVIYPFENHLKRVICMPFFFFSFFLSPSFPFLFLFFVILFWIQIPSQSYYLCVCVWDSQYLLSFFLSGIFCPWHHSYETTHDIACSTFVLLGFMWPLPFLLPSSICFDLLFICEVMFGSYVVPLYVMSSRSFELSLATVSYTFDYTS